MGRSFDYLKVQVDDANYGFSVVFTHQPNSAPMMHVYYLNLAIE